MHYLNSDCNNTVVSKFIGLAPALNQRLTPITKIFKFDDWASPASALYII